MQRIFDGHVKSLKILKEFIPEASLQPDPVDRDLLFLEAWERTVARIPFPLSFQAGRSIDPESRGNVSNLVLKQIFDLEPRPSQ